MCPKPTILITERLVLRELQLTDEEEIYRLRSDAGVNEFIDRPRALTHDDARDFIEKILARAADDQAVFWAITLTGEPKLAGTVLYWNIEWENDKAEIGYELLPEYQGKGIMAEALKKVIEFGFKTLKFKKITAVPNAKHKRSVALLERMGFVRTRIADDGYLWFELDAGR